MKVKRPRNLKTQSFAVLITLIWTIITTYVILKIISFFIPLRVDEEEEIQGFRPWRKWSKKQKFISNILCFL